MANPNDAEAQDRTTTLPDDIVCPFCGGRGFQMAAKDSDEPIALLYESSSRSWFGPPGYLRVFALICDHCGYVATFAADRLKRWRSARVAQGETGRSA
ncbi:MAG TPA: hypothetical protein VF342_03080 [Alphaproteobacteria bacterium]